MRSMVVYTSDRVNLIDQIGQAATSRWSQTFRLALLPLSARSQWF